MGIEGVLSLPRLAHIEGVRRVAQLKQGIVEVARLLSRRQEQRLQGWRRASVWPGFALSTAISDIILKPLQHDLADGASGFQLAMRFLQIGGGDGAVVFAKGGFDSVVVDQRRHAGEQLMLGDHIIRLKH